MKDGRQAKAILISLGLLWLGCGFSSDLPDQTVNGSPVQLLWESIEAQKISKNPESGGLPVLEEDNRGRLWTAWEEWLDGGSRVIIGRLEDDGDLTRVSTASPDGSNFSPDLCFGPDGSPWAAWGNFADQGYSIYVQDIASQRRWRFYTAEAAAVTDPKVVFDGSGFAWVFWNETKEKSWRVVFRRFDGTAWSPAATVLREAAVPWVNPDIARDGKGSLWLTWSGYDGADYEVYLARWNGAGWTAAIPLTDNGQNDLYPSLAIGPEDLPVISWERSGRKGNQVFAVTYKEGDPVSETAVSPPDRQETRSRTVSLGGKVRFIWKSAGELVVTPLESLSAPPEKTDLDPSAETPPLYSPERDENAYVGFGDSITYGYIDRLPTPDLGYPPRLAIILNQNFGPTEMINEGIGGEATPEGLARIDSVLAAHPARYILIMEGTNDVIRNTLSMDTSVFNIREMVRKCREAGVFPTITTIVPRRDWAWSNPQVRTRQFYLNDQIRQIPAELNVSFIDMDQLFLHYPAADGGLLAVLSNDLKHPSEKGYQFMAETWFEEITSYPFPPYDVRLIKKIPKRGPDRDEEMNLARVPENRRPPVQRKTGNDLIWRANPKIFNPARIKGYNIYRADRDISGEGFRFLVFVPDLPGFFDIGFDVIERYDYLISTVRDDDVEGPCSGLIGQ
jgi:lysophospholipase L1-like esterase